MGKELGERGLLFRKMSQKQIIPMNALVWFTDNLRVADHPLLREACAQSQRVEAVYCFDPQNGQKNNAEQVLCAWS